MKKDRLILTLIIIFCLTSNFTYAYSQQTPEEGISLYTSYNKELEKIYGDIVRVRDNLYSIDVNPFNIDRDSPNLYKQLNFSITQLNSIRTNLNFHKESFKNSRPDILLASRLYSIVENLEVSVQEQINLVDLLVADAPKNSRVFYSEVMTHIYYYLTAANDMINYIADDYDFNN